MSDGARYALPRTMPELTGHGISTIVGGLTPAMLGVLLLNVIGIGAAVYFLNVLIKGQQTHLDALLDVQERQISQVLNTHNREFDSLMAMIRDASKKPVEPIVGLPMPLERPKMTKPVIMGLKLHGIVWDLGARGCAA